MYNNRLDRYNTLDDLSGKEKSPREEFVYLGGNGEAMSIRGGEWKVPCLKNSAHRLDVRRAIRPPSIAVPLQVRRDPFEK